MLKLESKPNGSDLDLRGGEGWPELVATAQMPLRLLWNEESELGRYELMDDICRCCLYLIP